MDLEEKKEEIFAAAIEFEDCAERNAYLARACGEDRGLFEKVQGLLRHHDVSSFLDVSPLELVTGVEIAMLTETPGTVIGRYKLLEKIGEGGMTVVFMAEQQEPIRRKVALKVIKLGMDTRQVIARFEAERQALALMDHPSIAKVLDAGATETGRPFFVMELVQGVSITEYCDKNSLSTKDRLTLFLQVCHAVQHAHQKGIIHRDIKPSNVMVTHHDGKPVPKVIDFGIAKATVGANNHSPLLTEKTLFTRYAHIIGTPAYMSPEQAELSDLDIDTRSDIYSLGVLLYELLTGTTPFSEEELRKAGYVEMQRVIREQEPTKPSTKLSGLGDTLTDIAKHRGSTPDVLRKAIRGDLDWIVMKSLEKDRAQRYETPSALAEDLRRHLTHEPILARGPSTVYRLHKFLRRHRVQALAVVATVVVAGAGVAILSMWSRDRLQLAEAEGFRHRGILSQAREQYAKADREAALETIRPILESKHVGPEAQLLQAGILVDNRRSEEAVTILKSLLGERPEIAGAAHSLLARIVWETGSANADKLQEIEEHRRQAETLLPETADAYFLRAMTALTIKEQLAALDKALQLDPSHYESRRLQAYTYYASRKYEKMKDDALAMTILRPRDPLGYCLHAMAWRELKHYSEAIADYDRAMACTSREDPQYADLSAQRSETLLRMGAHARVIAEAPVGAKNLLPRQYHVFCALTALGDYEKAAALFRQIIAPGHETRRKFQDWCSNYVFDTLEAGQSWHPAARQPAGAAFLPMIEAEETHRSLSAKGRRLTTDGFGAAWSPEGRKLLFSLGVQGRSGVAVFDPATKETDLLIVPGKDPRWSPDGKYIAFVRDRQNLRLEELATAERGSPQPPVTDEEVWLMRADGTEPRRLARGSWPSWGSDSAHLYYLSRGDGTLCSVSLSPQDPASKPILKCSNSLPSVSPDNRQVAYFEQGSLKVKDLASQTSVAECPMPSLTWGALGWSPTGEEVCLGSSNPERERLGLWLYDLHGKQFLRVLDGQITSASWSPAATGLACCLGPPYYEIWAIALDPNVPTLRTLGPGQTVDEHLRAMVALHTRRIEADPQDAYAYSNRAHYYDCLHDREKARADMRQWSVALGGALPLDLPLGAPRRFRGAINGPFGYQLAFSVGGRDNGIPVLCVAFGQKGRCEMKVFEIPMLAMSLFGLGVLSGFDTPTVRADFTFGEPVRFGSMMVASSDDIDCFSSDGLEMYIDRGLGGGNSDLWVLKRASVDNDWGPPVDLGPAVNSPQDDACASISADGLTLYFQSTGRGGSGGTYIYMTTRASRSAPWGPAVKIVPTISSSTTAGEPWISTNGLELYFKSYQSGGYGRGDIWVARRTTENDPWGVAVNLGPVVNSPYDDAKPCLSPDGLVLFFQDTDAPRPGGYGKGDFWMTRRASLSDPWQTPVNLGPKVNGPDIEFLPRISPDGRTLYFWAIRGGVGDVWQAPIIPIVDFNADGKVDLVDLVMLIDNWGTNQTLCDIGPMPWGDGKVDIEDLKVFMTEWEKENPPKSTAR
ncbi:MAG: protein kinase [Phycisphaerae bacterium]|nr:protein kinase [Phycisphaerae bacterium]